MSGDGDTLAIGAPFEDSSATGVGNSQLDNLSLEAGAVYTFTRDAGNWAQQAYIKASNTGADDRFGSAVSLSSDGGTLAVSAVREDGSAVGVDGNQDDNSASDSGAVYVFIRSVIAGKI